MEIGFSLGSNLGERLHYLSEAKRRMLAVPGTVLLARSPVYETEPVDVAEAYRGLPYLNAVLVLESSASAREWLERRAVIEEELGRVRGADRHLPRTIDIDILYAGDEYVDSGGLIVPHPRWAQRRFVVQPLADVRPDLVLPGAAQTVSEVLAGLPEREAVALYADAW